MTMPEFLAWWEFHQMWPIDDLHRIHRPAAVIASSSAGIDPDVPLAWLERRAPAGERVELDVKKPGPSPEIVYSDADMNTMRALGAIPGKARSARWRN